MQIYIDAGANSGEALARELWRMNEKGLQYDYVFAIEPNPEMLKLLHERFPHGDVQIEGAAVWTTDGENILYLGDPLSSTMVEGKVALKDHPEYTIDYRNGVLVRTIDFSRWLHANVPPNATATVKMDIEGAEYQVLEALLISGAIDLIAELRCEFHQDRFPAYAVSHDEIKKQVALRTKLVDWR